MSPFFKNDDNYNSSYDSHNYKKLVTIVIYNKEYYAIDEIFPSCSGIYYIHYKDGMYSKTTPIDIVSLPDDASSLSENSFIYQHLEEYKTKMIRTKKLNRII